MAARLIFLLLAFVIAIPIDAACPQVKPEAVPDCCHKPCPKPVKVQPCFDCVADIRTTAVTNDVPTPAAAPALIPFPIAFAALPLRPSEPPRPLQDHSSTYLRIGVLRI